MCLRLKHIENDQEYGNGKRVGHLRWWRIYDNQHVNDDIMKSFIVRDEIWWIITADLSQKNMMRKVPRVSANWVCSNKHTKCRGSYVMSAFLSKENLSSEMKISKMTLFKHIFPLKRISFLFFVTFCLLTFYSIHAYEHTSKTNFRCAT